MADTNIRHTKNGKHYKAPVMLAHRTMVRMGMGVILSMGIMFAGGYVVGFKKAENRVNQQIQNMELQPVEAERSQPLSGLPSGPLYGSVSGDPGNMELQASLLADPVEIADAGNSDGRQVVVLEAVDQDVRQRVINVAARAVEKDFKLEGESENRQNTGLVALPMIAAGAAGGAVESGSDQNTMGRIAIYDNANMETASYSIQVGMFERRENAERKVEELMAVDLSAYLVEYANKQNKRRYKVLFGYFADRKSALSALVKYEKELAGSGYVTPLPSAKNPISKHPV